MATFLETPRFPDDIAFWAQGGARYNTIVTTSTSGREKRNGLWQYSLGMWSIQNVSRTVAVPQAYNIAQIRNFFRAMKGQLFGFRFRDWTDYQDDGAGFLGSAFTGYSTVPVAGGNGTASYQMYKLYSETPFYDYRVVQKPYNGGGISIYRNGALVTPGTGAGQYSLDTTTGIVTFVADGQNTNISAITPGATTTIPLLGPVAGLVVGDYVYVTAESGSIGAFLNNKAWQVTAISGSNITIAANTTGLTGGTGGMVQRFPQPTETLTWTGMFDTPCRFSNDKFDAAFTTDGLVTLNLEIVEIRL
jgi:uncharacterized protein (TIGR02217 family)